MKASQFTYLVSVNSVNNNDDVVVGTFNNKHKSHLFAYDLLRSNVYNIINITKVDNQNKSFPIIQWRKMNNNKQHNYKVVFDVMYPNNQHNDNSNVVYDRAGYEIPRSRMMDVIEKYAHLKK